MKFVQKSRTISRGSSPSQNLDTLPKGAFENLAHILRLPYDKSGLHGSTTEMDKPERKKQRSELQLVVLSFDEAHTIADRKHAADGTEWSIFSELCHVLRTFHTLPLFSLFLSTTSKICQFTYAKEEDASKRVVDGKIHIIQPYADLGFDPPCM